MFSLLLKISVLFVLITVSSGQVKLGTVSYWNNEISLGQGVFDFTKNIKSYDRIPNNSLTILNPNYGIFGSLKPHLDEVCTIVANGAKRGVQFLGYVPTSYGHRKNGSMKTNPGSWENIEKHVEFWLKEYKDLAGIFFDEVNGNYTDDYEVNNKMDCERVKSDMQRFRDFVAKYKPGALVAFNPAWFGVDGCYLKAALPNEIVSYESEGCKYLKTDLKACPSDVESHMKDANSLPNHSKTWHIISSVLSSDDMKKVVDKSIQYKADYIYSTETNTGYKTVPEYYEDEISYISSKK